MGRARIWRGTFGGLKNAAFCLRTESFIEGGSPHLSGPGIQLKWWGCTDESTRLGARKNGHRKTGRVHGKGAGEGEKLVGRGGHF